MTILDLTRSSLDNTFEPEVLPKGEEVELRIVSFLSDKNKEGNPYLMPFFEVVGQDRVKEFGDYIELPHEGMNEKRLNQAKLKLTNFFKAFGIDYSQEINLKEEVGNTGWVVLGVGKDQDDQPVNKVAKYIAGN